MDNPPVDLDRLEAALRWPGWIDGEENDDRLIFAAIEELRSLRAWKARLGPVESWFPHLDKGPPGDFADWAWAVIAEAHALLKRAKEEK